MAAKTAAARRKNAIRAGVISMSRLTPKQRTRKARRAARTRWATTKKAKLAAVIKAAVEELQMLESRAS